MKLIFTGLLGIGLCSSLLYAEEGDKPATVKVSSIEDAVKLAIKNHPALSAARNASNASKEGISEAEGELYPSIDLRSAVGREQTENSTVINDGDQHRSLTRFESSILIRQNLYTGGRISGNIEKRKNLASESFHQYLNEKERTVFNAIDAYIEYWPTDVTVTEDTASNVDFSAITFADIDSATITVTLTASAGTFSNPADGAGVGGGVTETLVSSTVITLVGSPADINTYLDTASNIQYTGATNVSGNDAATITVTANDGDGSGNVNLGTVNLDITAVNDAPTATGIPTDVTVTEDTASNVNLSAVTFSDVDGDSLTITLEATAGTFASSSGGGVTIGGSGTSTLTLSGTTANINTFLDTVTNIQYTGASNVNGNDAASFTIKANDGTVNPTLGTVNIDI